ncbi:MAG: DUF2335 domain-containing protein [Planctomycetota bacterium]|nr:DUF2335 domain-containing protein [Planctomycetota bacterium]
MSHKIVTWRSGPIPSHEEFAGYNEVLPGAANRILAMAEQQTLHRHGLENRVIKHDIIKSYAGLVCGLIVCLAGFYTAFKTVELGYPVVGMLFGAAPLCGLVAVFIKATNLRQRERDTMRQMQDNQNQR